MKLLQKLNLPEWKELKTKKDKFKWVFSLVISGLMTLGFIALVGVFILFLVSSFHSCSTSVHADYFASKYTSSQYQFFNRIDGSPVRPSVLGFSFTTSPGDPANYNPNADIPYSYFYPEIDIIGSFGQGSLSTDSNVFYLPDLILNSSSSIGFFDYWVCRIDGLYGAPLSNAGAWVIWKNAGLVRTVYSSSYQNPNQGEWRLINGVPVSISSSPVAVHYGFCTYKDVVPSYLTVVYSSGLVEPLSASQIVYIVQYDFLVNGSDITSIILLQPFSGIINNLSSVSHFDLTSNTSDSDIPASVRQQYRDIYYSQGYQQGFDNAMSANSSIIADTSAYAYQNGYNDGLNTEFADISPFQIIKSGVDNIFDIELFAGFKLSTLFYIALGLLLFGILYKILS